MTCQCQRLISQQIQTSLLSVNIATRKYPSVGLRAHLQICQRINVDDQDQEHHDEDISDQESELSMTNQECKADQIFPSMSKSEIDKDWEQELSTLFPDADRDEIGDAIFGSLSIEEAANHLIDTTQKDNKVIHKENSFKSATPASLTYFFTNFTTKHYLKGAKITLHVDREELWVDTFKFHK